MQALDHGAELDVMHDRLQAWAAWLKGDRPGVGFPTKSVLHPSWMPPAPGQAPSMRAAPHDSTAGRALRMHQAIISLSVKLQNTLVVVYLMRASVAQQADLLNCQESTVRARLAEAKRLLLMQAEQGF